MLSRLEREELERLADDQGLEASDVIRMWIRDSIRSRATAAVA
jgi:hypothetical protein